MRGDRSVPRGEAGRVALRVRELLGTDDAAADGDLDGGAGLEDDGDWDELHLPAAPGPTRWERVQARVPVRIDPGHRAAWGVGVAVALAAVITGLWLMSSRPAAVPVAARVPQVPGSAVLGSADVASGSTGGSASLGSASQGSGSQGSGSGGGPSVAAIPSPSPAGVVVIDVAGKVARPGLYRLPTGSRVDDAIRAAGGARRGVDLTSLNLAAPLADGQQILVGVPGAGVQDGGSGTGAGGSGSTSTGSGSTGSGGTGAPAGPVDLNTAGLEQLDSLPGIGPALAQRILDWRSQHGRFATVDQLNDVSGIGDVKFAELKSLVTV